AETGKDVNEKIIANRVEVAMKMLDRTNRELTEVQSELRRLQIEEKLLLEANPKTIQVSETMIEEEIKKHPLMLPFVKQQQDLDKEIGEWQSRAPGHAKVTQLKEDGAGLQKKIEAKKIEIRPLVEAALRNKLLTGHDAQLAMLRSRMRQNQEWEKE